MPSSALAARPLTRLAAAGALLLLTACGGAGDGDAGPVASVQPGATLLASVGTESEPEAFVIALTDEAGNRLREVPAGDYTIRVTDPSRSHNIRLTGEGVDEATSVPEVEDATWTVRFRPGEYEYVCDPHVGSMNGSVTVV